MGLSKTKIGEMIQRRKVESEITSFMCDLKDKDRLWELAEENDCNLSDIIRLAVKELIKMIDHKGVL